jgi:hypothetical protein
MSVKLTIQRASSVRHNSSFVRRKDDSRTATVTVHPNCATFLDSPAGSESLWRIEIGAVAPGPMRTKSTVANPVHLSFRRGPPDDQRTRLGRATHVAPGPGTEPVYGVGPGLGCPVRTFRSGGPFSIPVRWGNAIEAYVKKGRSVARRGRGTNADNTRAGESHRISLELTVTAEELADQWHAIELTMVAYPADRA